MMEVLSVLENSLIGVGVMSEWSWSYFHSLAKSAPDLLIDSATRTRRPWAIGYDPGHAHSFYSSAR